jgi:hypothetical protein
MRCSSVSKSRIRKGIDGAPGRLRKYACGLVEDMIPGIYSPKIDG